mgnify:CR=1 FL=1
MKKTLKKDITRYDKKMQLRVDSSTIKATGISLAIAAPIFILINLAAGMIPALFLSFTVLCILMLFQIGKIDGISLSQYIGKILRFAFCPKERKKHYSHESGEYRIYVMTERELKQKRKEKQKCKKEK